MKLTICVVQKKTKIAGIQLIYSQQILVICSRNSEDGKMK